MGTLSTSPIPAAQPGLHQTCMWPLIYLPSVYDPRLHQHPTCVLRKGAFY